tara:strand:+ start:292 stop:510 length:219 start_codon:yes stop_codon:yes gene_type:complete
MKINNEYKYFVICNESHMIVAGNEFKDDAMDVMDELNDEYYSPLYKTYTASYIINKLNINPFNSNNWTNPTK